MTELDLDRLRGRKLFVGTPMYDGRCCSEFALSIARLTALCTRLDIDLRFYFACHEALITKARNITVDEFLRAGDDNLIFIDADIGFDPRDVIHLLALQTLDDRGFDVIAAPYPLKRFAWDKIRQAAKAGLADVEADRLGRFSSNISVSPAHDRSFPINAPVEVTQAGTGFMMIRRATFDECRRQQPWRTYRPERRGLEEHASAEIYAYFDTEIDAKHSNMREEIKIFLMQSPQASPAEIRAFLDSDDAMGVYSGNYVSEDYAFCRRVRKFDMKVWLCPWMELTHTGNHQFNSRLADLGQIGAI